MVSRPDLRSAAGSLLRPALFTALVTGLITAAPGAQRQQFRGRVVLIPVDVRVVDSDGHPVLDLTRDDFEVFENGARQEVSHFSVLRFDDPRPGHDTTAPLSAVAGSSVPMASHRTFLVVLGRGRLQGPAKGLEALVTTVRDRLLPSDRVGVVVYDRLTEFTTDRDAVVQLLHRYRDRHERIEAILDQWFTGLQLSYGGGDRPPIEDRISEIFAAEGLPASRHLGRLSLPEDGHYERERQRSLELDQDFIYLTEARDDLERLHGAVEYLRHLDGEKHLIFLSESGLRRVPPEDVDRLAALAADARVALSAIHTSGLETSWTTGPTRAFVGPSWARQWATRDSRALAEHTGGIASDYQFASRTLDRLDRLTRVSYVLGYYPADANWNGDYRRIEVRVKRADVRVLYRHGFYARTEPAVFDRKALITRARLAAGAGYRQRIRDIPVTAQATVVSREDDRRTVRVQLEIDPAAVRFEIAGGRHSATISLAVYVGDRGRNSIGELRRTIDLRLTPANHAQLLQPGRSISYSTDIEVTAAPRYLKVVVYDYAADKLGTETVEVR